MNDIDILGDPQLNPKQPYLMQGIELLHWFMLQPTNKEGKSLIILGDLIESVTDDQQHQLMSIFAGAFLNKSKYKKIYILQGNHDLNMNTNFLDSFSEFEDIEVIRKPCIKTIEGVRFLFLPHYKHELNEMPPMKEFYESILDSELGSEIKKGIDYCLHHLQDHTQSFGDDSKSIDLKLIETYIKSFICGHIHLCDLQKGGHYLGSIGLNNKKEMGKDSYFATIKSDTKEYELIKFPKLLEFYDVNYPEVIDIKLFDEVKYPIFTVHESMGKKESIEYYTNQLSEKHFVFYHRKIISKKEVIGQDYDSETNDLSDLEMFEEYCELNKISDNIKVICSKALEFKA